MRWAIEGLGPAAVRGRLRFRGQLRGAAPPLASRTTIRNGSGLHRTHKRAGGAVLVGVGVISSLSCFVVEQRRSDGKAAFISLRVIYRGIK